jgi:hypothetical protein
MSDGWSDYRRLYGQGEAQSGGPVSAPFANYQWPRPIVPRFEDDGALARIDRRLAEQAAGKFYGEAHNARNRAQVDAIVDRHRTRTIYGPDVDADAARVWGLSPMPDAFYAFWLGRDGCL